MNWICPNCGSHTTLQSPNFKLAKTDVTLSTATDQEGIRFEHRVIKCPNQKCLKFTVSVSANFHNFKNYGNAGILYSEEPFKALGSGAYRFEPRVGVPLSKYVPKVCSDDYEEATLILDISPKAAAALCRRALQGMIRDFWGISKARLADELKAIETQCDPALYKALVSLKAVGNIGAHPERDINLIVDVEPNEVHQLLELLRLLDGEWYVAKALRAERLSSIAAIGANKAVSKQANAATSPAPPYTP